MTRNFVKGAGLAAWLAMAAPGIAQEAGEGSAGGLAGDVAGTEAGSTGSAESGAGGGPSGSAFGGSGPGTGISAGGSVTAGGGMAGFGVAGEGGIIGFEVAFDPRSLPTTLDQALQRALANNPDIHVAEANLRQAQAAYEQAKLKLTHQVMIAMEQAEVDRIAFERIAELAKANTVSQQEQQTARFAARKSQLELQYLLGDSPVGIGSVGPAGNSAGMGGSYGAPGGEGISTGGGGLYGDFGPSVGGTGSAFGNSGAGATGLGNTGGGAMEGATDDVEGPQGTGDPMGAGDAGAAGGALGPQSSMREKLGESLAAKSGPVSFHEMPLDQFSQELSSKMSMPVIIDKRALVKSDPVPIDKRSIAQSNPVTMELDRDNLTWRDVLLAISDTHDLAFVIRDYGILITTPEKASAVSLGGGSGYSGGGREGGDGGIVIGARPGDGGGF